MGFFDLLEDAFQSAVGAVTDTMMSVGDKANDVVHVVGDAYDAGANLVRGDVVSAIDKAVDATAGAVEHLGPSVAKSVIKANLPGADGIMDVIDKTIKG